MNIEKLLSKKKIEKAFKTFDYNNDGYISQDELKQVMGDEIINNITWQEILNIVDLNNDGKFSQDEFVKFMKIVTKNV